MDTITTTTIQTITTSLIPNMDAISWILLFSGWLLYWLQKLNQYRIEKKGEPFAKFFFKDNMFEIPTSVIACLVLAILGDSIPPDLLDMHGRISTLIVGYSASSILNSLITMGKRQQ